MNNAMIRFLYIVTVVVFALIISANDRAWAEDDEKLISENISPLKTPSEEEKKCTELGGRWAGNVKGRGRVVGCVMPALDAKKVCSDNEDCQSNQCVVQAADCNNKESQNNKESKMKNCTFKAACHSELSILKGCHSFMVKGELKSLCID